MNQRNSFLRKVIYGVLIAALLFPLSLLSAPATVDSAGGTLAQLRSENKLSQADLGEIDPASETIKLATLGLRGVAVQFLWNKAIHYKKVEDWTNLTATLEQLAKLQPNFITFWKYQSWNLSYNVSVEFDDYNDRYYWVRRGIQFMQDGVQYNRDSPALLWELGWMIGQKVGKADEKVQYRRLFKADEEFHPEDRPPAQRDNWLVAKEAYLESVAAVDERGADLGRKSPNLFYSSAPKALMSYAAAIEEEGLFGRAVAAWKQAGEEWADFGNYPIEHSTGKILVYNDLEYLQQRADEISQQLGSIVEGVEEQIIAEAREGLTKEQLEAYETPIGEREEEQFTLANEAKRALEVTPEKRAAKIAELKPEKEREAKELTAELLDTLQTIRYITSYKDTTNYEYWALRCEFEQSKEAIAARKLVFDAKRLYRDEADMIGSKKLYEQAFARWAEVFEKFPELKDPDGTTGDDVMYVIKDYARVLEQLDEQIPDDFPLWEIIRDFDSDGDFTMQLSERDQRVGVSVADPTAQFLQSALPEESESEPETADEQGAQSPEGQSTDAESPAGDEGPAEATVQESEAAAEEASDASS